MILTMTMNPAIDKIYFVKQFEKGEVHRPVEMVASPGGKGLNVSRVIKTIGGELAATGLLGGGNGAFIQHQIGNLGIENRFYPIEGETRICINITDTDDLTSTEVLEAGPEISAGEAEGFMDALKTMLDDVTILTISGSLPKGLPQDFYYRVIQLAKRRHIKVLLDSSGQAYLEGIKAKPFLIKPNKDEIKMVYDGPMNTTDDYITAIQFLHQLGIEMPIISMGKEGSIAGYKGMIYRTRFPELKVVNTVGSGDSFIAGCAVGLSKGFEFEDILKLATACGCANTLNPQTGVVKMDDVNELLTSIELVRVH